MKKLMLAILAMLSFSAQAYDITTEINLGRHGEMQYRFGSDYWLTSRLALNNGISLIKYDGAELRIGVVDSTLLYRLTKGKIYFDIGTGLALWTKKNWDLQQSATLWTFSNRMDFGYMITKNIELSIDLHHYSNLSYNPNSSKDFIGLDATFKF